MIKKGYSVEAKSIEKTIKNKTILKNLNLKINSGEFIAIVGSSGAGKTTLINLLSGYTKPTKGKILINTEDLNNNYKTYKNKIAYVPQVEILHKELTLKKALYYAYELKNNTKQNRDKKVNEIINELLLNDCKNTLIKNLSGGERKRASIAVELLDNPEVLFLDEPTSGLDSNTEKKIMKILKEIAKSGKTIIITAHTVSNLHMCDNIVFMGLEGKICYYGSFENSMDYFKVKEFVDIYDILKINTNEWHKKYNDIYIEKRKMKKQPLEKQNKNESIQFLLLAKRYIEIIYNNKILFLLLILQAPIMGYLISLVGPENSFDFYDKAKVGLFALTSASIWMGLFNSIQEICKEKNIIKKEHSDSLKISSYIYSKLSVYLILSLIQSILLIIVTSIFIKIPNEGLLINNTIIELIITSFLINFSSTCIGIFISSIVKKIELTMIIAPFFMMFQLLFSGALMKIEGISKLISNVIPGRWAMEAYGSSTNLIKIATNSELDIQNQSLIPLQPDISKSLFLDEAKEFYAFTTNHLTNVWIIFIIISLLFIILSIITIKKSLSNK